MDLKNTKVTELPFTASRFSETALARGIVKLSAASKSSSENLHYCKSQSAGLRAEEAVIKKMQNAGWTLVFQRAATYIGEIDLIFEKSEGSGLGKIVLIEVKKLNSSWRAFERIQLSQTQKLQMNLIYLTKKFVRYQIYASLCWVDQRNKVYFVEIN